MTLCSSAYAATNGTLDQETFFDYDDAGRVIREYIRDDTGRIADHVYTWTKSSELASVTTPSGAVIGSTYGSAGSNSDTDSITAIWRTNTSTPVADAITWFPYGPLKQYNQQNAVSNKAQRTVISRNLAYRITNIAVENQSNGADTFAVAIAEDAKGRVTKRDYSLAAAGVQDSYFLYDNQDRVLCETTNLVTSCPTSGSNIKNSRTATAFTAAGDWRELLRPVPGSTGLMNSFNPSGYGTSHQVTMVRQNDGTPQLGDTIISYDARGNRSSDDNTSGLTNDLRSYSYDGRGNVISVQGKYFTGGTWRDYEVVSALDSKSRRVMKSFRDASTGVTAQWFFYYDPADRLIEIRHTPNTAIATTYTQFQLFWLRDRVVAFWQTDLPTGTIARRYTSTDETGRPVEMWSWPTSGNATRVWAVNPTAWGFESVVLGSAVFQPRLFAGQYDDTETAAFSNDGATIHRPGTAYNRFRTYDPNTGGYLQVDPLASTTFSSYVYAQSNPNQNRDPSGLGPCDEGEACGEGGTVDGPGACWLPHCPALCGIGIGAGFGCACNECGGGSLPSGCRVWDVLRWNGSGPIPCLDPAEDPKPTPEPEPEPGLPPPPSDQEFCAAFPDHRACNKFWDVTLVSICDVCERSCELRTLRMARDCDRFVDRNEAPAGVLDYKIEAGCFAFWGRELARCKDECITSGECLAPAPSRP